MSHSVIDYLKMLLKLLPFGNAWDKSPDSTIYATMYAQAEELARVDNRSSDLIEESDPRTTTELINDFERDLGLPDDCVDTIQTLAERRSSAHAKLVTGGGLNKQIYIDLAANLGWTVEIDEDPGIDFCFEVSVFIDSDNWQYFVCGSSQCGDYLIQPIGTSHLRCIFEKYKPAHTQIIWSYNGIEFDASFSTAFNSVPSSDSAFIAGGFWRGFDSAFSRYYGGGGFESTAFNNGFLKPY